MRFAPLALAAVATLAAGPLAAQQAPNITVDMMGPDGGDRGTVELRQMRRGLLLEVRLTGLPEGGHGFHVHDRGDCAPSFESAGSHFAPRGMEHGYANPNGPHAGDLPNVHADAEGRVRTDMFTDRVSLLRRDLNTLVDEDGSALVVHERPDDYTADLETGARIACGVIVRN